MGIGRRRVVAAERLDLGADDALRGGDIVGGAGRRGEADQECDEQQEGAHDGAPLGGYLTLRYGAAQQKVHAFFHDRRLIPAQ